MRDLFEKTSLPLTSAGVDPRIRVSPSEVTTFISALSGYEIILTRVVDEHDVATTIIKIKINNVLITNSLSNLSEELLKIIANIYR
jgi:hypothetical protein